MKAGASTEAEVRRGLGTPALDLGAPGGKRILAYPTGPLGTETILATIGADGVLVAVDQALNEDRFQSIHPGRTSAEEVRRLIGPPWRMIPFDNLGQVAWDYRFRDAWGYLAEFSVMMGRDGIVASKVTSRLEPRDARGRH